MDRYIERQLKLMHKFILDYRSGRMDLNSLVLKIEGIRDVVDIEKMKEQLYLFILSLEQINASIIEGGRELTEVECNAIAQLLDKLEALIKHGLEFNTAPSARNECP